MASKIDQFVKIIKAPIVCKIDGKELAFANGEELAAHDFEKYYLIDSIEVEEGKAILKLKDNSAPNYSGDDNSQDEEWIKRHIEKYGKEPNLLTEIKNN